ncbi:hypothetical protein [Rugosimonospora africana]|uniref:hypothetical protein n=1 Tax=Rugosimonospora africana TaxID=556532 RepID=UPI001EF3A444|nr:hypothetical protein [Rugosimonospora africana]
MRAHALLRRLPRVALPRVAAAGTLSAAVVGATILLGAGPAVAAGPTIWMTANSASAGDQDGAAIAANRAGDVAVTWEDDRDSTDPGDNTHSEIYLRLFHNGVSSYEVKLSGGGTAGTNWRHLTPDVGLDDRGDAVVVWADDPDGNGFYNVAYRVVSPAGAILGSGHANADSGGQQINPKVSVDPDGAPTSATAVAFTAVWEDIQGTAAATVKAAGFTGTATKAYEVTVNQAGGSHHRPDVAVSASGDATVVWDEDTDGNGFYNIGLTRLAKANGAVTLSRRSANTVADGQQEHPAIAANFNGGFTVAWESDHTGTPGVWARSFAANGTGSSAEVQVSSGTGAANPSVGVDDQGDAVVGWSVAGTDPAVWARGLNPDGTTAGRLPAQSCSQVTTGRQEELAVASSPFGQLALAYTDDNDGNGFDQVILGLGASNSDW